MGARRGTMAYCRQQNRQIDQRNRKVARTAIAVMGIATTFMVILALTV